VFILRIKQASLDVISILSKYSYTVTFITKIKICLHLSFYIRTELRVVTEWKNTDEKKALRKYLDLRGRK
jgi:hypothetical protein